MKLKHIYSGLYVVLFASGTILLMRQGIMVGRVTYLNL